MSAQELAAHATNVKRELDQLDESIQQQVKANAQLKLLAQELDKEQLKLKADQKREKLIVSQLDLELDDLKALHGQKVAKEKEGIQKAESKQEAYFLDRTAYIRSCSKFLESLLSKGDQQSAWQVWKSNHRNRCQDLAASINQQREKLRRLLCLKGNRETSLAILKNKSTEIKQQSADIQEDLKQAQQRFIMLSVEGDQQQKISFSLQAKQQEKESLQEQLEERLLYYAASEVDEKQLQATISWKESELQRKRAR